MTIGRFTGIQVQNKVCNPTSPTFCTVNGVFQRSGTCFADTDVLFFTRTSDSDRANHLSVNDDWNAPYRVASFPPFSAAACSIAFPQ
jgi:hypothetical protein